MPPSPLPQAPAPAIPQHQADSGQHAPGVEESAGKTLARNPDSPSGQFGMPVQMQAAPQVIQRKPSDEVPDLEEDVVNKINAALKAGDKQKALDLVLAALVAKDAGTFNKDFLVGKKLYSKGGGDSLTEIGPKFTKWLTKQLEAGPKAIKTDKDECAKYLKTLTVPADMPDIKISIANARFKSASVLYSVIRHEFIHYQQIKKNPLQYIPTSEWPAGFANPGHPGMGKAREVEAYLWEAENMDKTGVAKDPQFVWNKFEMLNSSMQGALASEVKPLQKRWKAALANLFKTALDGYITQAEALIKKAGKDTMDDAAFKELKAAFVYCEDLWGYRANFSSEAKLLKKRYDALEKYIDATKSSKVAAKFPGILAKAEKDFKGAKSGYDGYNVWRPLHDEWIKLDAKGQAQFVKDYTKVMAPMWTTSFDMLNTRMKALYAKDKDDGNLTSYASTMLKMLNRADASKVDPKVKAAKQAILDKWKKDLGLY